MLLAAAGPAVAQVSSAASAQKGGAPAAAASAVPAASTSNPLTYRSVFDGYRSFSDQQVVSWRDANNLVGRIGGWQAYAREGQDGAAVEGSSPAANDGVPTMPSGHAGHGGMTMKPAASAPSRAPGRTASSPAPAKVLPSPAKPASGAGGHSGHHSP